jgi:hypothetical protein
MRTNRCLPCDPFGTAMGSARLLRICDIEVIERGELHREGKFKNPTSAQGFSQGAQDCLTT